jgi:hypothetical protein
MLPVLLKAFSATEPVSAEVDIRSAQEDATGKRNPERFPILLDRKALEPISAIANFW